jgi:hypothetical protein
VTLCAQSGATEPTASSENRLNAIEKMLVSQQDIIQKLLFASTAPPRSARTPDDIYEPPPACTPEDIYEPPPAPLTPTPEGIYNRTRIEAGFSDHCEWNAAYIHGLIRIRGERSRSITMDPPCGLCSTRGPAVCVMPAEDDPYYGFLVVENRVCCGWCEYEKAQGEEDQRLIEKGLKTSSTSAPTENQEREQEQAEPTKGKKQENLSACQSKIFISGEGLDREVMMTDIPRYLGVDSIVRPGTRRVRLPPRELERSFLIASQDPMTSEVTEGYYITAYRPPTSVSSLRNLANSIVPDLNRHQAMLVDLREDSAAWQAEKKKRKLDNATACVQELYSGKLSGM